MVDLVHVAVLQAIQELAEDLPRLVLLHQVYERVIRSELTGK